MAISYKGQTCGLEVAFDGGEVLRLVAEVELVEHLRLPRGKNRVERRVSVQRRRGFGVLFLSCVSGLFCCRVFCCRVRVRVTC